MHLNNKKIIYYETIDSTQLEAWRLGSCGKIQSGTMIVADLQTAGIGTHGRTWITDEKDNIAISIYYIPNCKVETIKIITIEIAEKIVSILETQIGVKLDIKKPNDLYWKGRKIGGILVETKVRNGTVSEMVIGIGINTNKEKFEGELEGKATSIKKEFGVSLERGEFISAFLES